jgi:hypothetical protein
MKEVLELQSGFVAIKGYFKFKLVVSLFPFPLAATQVIGDVLTNRQSGDKMFLSAITAPMYWCI